MMSFSKFIFESSHWWGNEDLSVPYEDARNIPFIEMVTKSMRSYLLHQALVLLEPKLIKYTRFVDHFYDGALIPVGVHRRLGLLSYEFPCEKSSLDRISSGGPDEIFHKEFPNFTIFIDARNNSSAAWGDRENVKLLISTFSNDKSLKMMTDKDHRKFGRMFGYKENYINDWIHRNSIQRSR